MGLFLNVTNKSTNTNYNIFILFNYRLMKFVERANRSLADQSVPISLYLIREFNVM